MKPVAIISFLLFFITFKNDAQEYNYYHYDIKDGLSGITVYSVAQDKDGFLWFGTETGLSRFDGSHFKNYTANEGLNDNEIINLFVDSKNRVWIFPFKNSVYYYYHGKIHNSTNDPLLKQFNLKNEIFKASEDKDGNIFFLETDRLHILSKNNDLKELNHFDGKDFYNDGCGVSANGNCNLLISFKDDIVNHRINSYEYENARFVFKELMQDYNLNRNTVEVNGKFRVMRNADFFEVFNRQTNTQFQIKVPANFHTISYINDANFAISTTEKTLLFNTSQEKAVDSFLSHKTVNNCFKDNEDNLWFATMSHGVYRLSSTKFKVYTFENNLNTLPVYAVSKLKNHLYVGTSEVLLWDLNLQKSTINIVNTKTDYTVGRISSIQTLNNQELIIGSDNGIFTINALEISNEFPRTSVKNLFVDSSAVVLVSDRNVLRVSLPGLDHTDTIWYSRATCACISKNHYYIGTLGGLYVVEKNSHTSTAEHSGNSAPVLKKRIVAVTANANGYVWVATGSDGLICLKDNSIAYRITAENGLTSNVCRCLYASNNNLWVGTDKGVSKIDISRYPFKVTHFTAAEGLDCEIINCIYAEGDSVFAGTPFGITFFDAGKIENKSICELKLVDIQSKNNNWYYNQDSIHLLSNDNFLRFEYAGISFVSSGDITYYYQLNGLNNAWNSTKQNSVEFEELPPGEYQFKLYAINKYGIKSKMVNVSFVKAETFWQLLWVRALIILVFATTMWMLIKARIKMIRRNANEKIYREREMHELEQMAMRAQMNPHFIFNSLNSIQQYIFSGNVIEANQFITNFSSIIRQTLLISGKKFISLDEEIKYLDTYLNLEQSKYENIFDFQINYSKEILPENIIIPPLLLQPFAENSIRHGMLNLKERRGNISVTFSLENNILVCVIEDNGIGRENAIRFQQASIPHHQSKGMELVKKRINSLNSIYNSFIIVCIDDIKEGTKTGTCVTIKLPFKL